MDSSSEQIFDVLHVFIRLSDGAGWVCKLLLIIDDRTGLFLVFFVDLSAHDELQVLIALLSFEQAAVGVLLSKRQLFALSARLLRAR